MRIGLTRTPPGRRALSPSEALLNTHRGEDAAPANSIAAFLWEDGAGATVSLARRLAPPIGADIIAARAAGNEKRGRN